MRKVFFVVGLKKNCKAMVTPKTSTRKATANAKSRKTAKKATEEKPTPYPPMPLGVFRDWAYISDTLFDDDLIHH